MSTALIKLCLELLIVWSCIVQGGSAMGSDACAEPDICDSVQVGSRELTYARGPAKGTAVEQRP